MILVIKNYVKKTLKHKKNNTDIYIMYIVSYVKVQSFIWCGSWLPTGIVHLRVCSGCLPIAPSQRVKSRSNPTVKREDLEH